VAVTVNHCKIAVYGAVNRGLVAGILDLKNVGPAKLALVANS
jgi:hypothetical protein